MWQCNKGHEWQALINNRSKGIGCPYCSNKKACEDNCLATKNPELAKEWHSIKNGILTPKDVLPSSNKKIWWKCKKGHEWITFINNRSAGKGCPYCAGQKVCEDNCLATVNPKLVKEWHPTKNGLLTPEGVLPNSDKEVSWRCSKGHDWVAAVKTRNKGNGCPYCANKKTNEGNCLATMNPVLAKEWHPTKNGALKPQNITPGSNKKVWWQCKRGHEWEAVASSRNAGTGCPKCSSSTSQLELRVFTELKHLFANVENRKKLFKVECDIYLPEIKLAIEIDGAYWHKNKERADKGKNKALQDKNIFLLRVRGYGLNKIAKQDILLPEKFGNFEVVKNILGAITNNKTLEKDCADKIKKYLKEKKIQNQKEYEELLFMLPGPLPGNSLFETNLELSKAWHPTKNGTLTSKNVASNSNKNVWWRCNKDHEWKSPVSNRSKGSGCPYCAGQRVTEGTSLAVRNPNLAKEWHPTKNGKLTPKDVMFGAGRKVWWQCNKGHEWEAKLNNRKHGRNCPYCSNKRAGEDNCLSIKNPKLAKEWNTTKNGALTPQNVLPGTNKKVWWQCQNGHEWQAVISHRTRGSGCPYCYNNHRRNRVYATNETCLARVNSVLAKEWHPTKNGKLTPKDVLPFSNKKVWWECFSGHEWATTVNHRSNGRGCPYCSGRKAALEKHQLKLDI